MVDFWFHYQDQQTSNFSSCVGWVLEKKVKGWLNRYWKLHFFNTVNPYQRYIAHWEFSDRHFGFMTIFGVSALNSRKLFKTYLFFIFKLTILWTRFFYSSSCALKNKCSIFENRFRPIDAKMDQQILVIFMSTISCFSKKRVKGFLKSDWL